VINQQVWTTELDWYPERLEGLWETFKNHPVSAASFLQVINKSNGHHESQLKPVVSTEKKSCVTQLQ